MEEITITKGWKGYLGGTLLIVLGIYLYFIGYTTEGIQSILIGLGILGIRHKLDRI